MLSFAIVAVRAGSAVESRTAIACARCARAEATRSDRTHRSTSRRCDASRRGVRRGAAARCAFRMRGAAAAVGGAPCVSSHDSHRVTSRPACRRRAAAAGWRVGRLGVAPAADIAAPLSTSPVSKQLICIRPYFFYNYGGEGVSISTQVNWTIIGA